MLKKYHYSICATIKSVYVLPFIVIFLILHCNIRAQEIEVLENPIIWEEVQKEKDPPPPFRFVENMPEPVEGFDAMYKFIEENIIYPEGVKKKTKNKEDQVFVEFIIEADGTISRPLILFSENPDLNEEVIRVISLLPKWKPAEHKGKFVRCLYQIPVRFTFDKG